MITDTLTQSLADKLIGNGAFGAAEVLAHRPYQALLDAAWTYADDHACTSTPQDALHLKALKLLFPFDGMYSNPA